ncbi:hypothetical protein M6D81_24610 [Paenibacillus sp. J5C_2022]|uniref:HEAT repeat domain-containing protein n=1 Tax=Paenibacillus sp. J5C2022 TaxID=2977129 RepID=UPI0021D0E809|nr:hypothetical protein [Paenibacillus sp. J5C2022]MCU6711888.1 hypothetical protein [Paenibacillus sp. J5C2022]
MTETMDSRRGTGSSPYSYKTIAPVVKALTSKGGGRYDTIADAYEKGVFSDFRLMLPAIDALDDGNDDIAYFVEAAVIPSYGQDAVPHLIAAMSSEAKKGDMRRIRLIGKLGGKDVEPLLLHYAESESVRMRAAAIQGMAGRDSLVERLMAWSTDKKKEVRRAALIALTSCRSEAAIKRAVEGISGKEEYYEYMDENDNSLFHSALARSLGEVLREVRLYPEADAKQEERYVLILRYIFLLRQKPADELYAVYSDMLDHAEHYERLGWLSELCNYASENLEMMATKAALQLLFRMELICPFVAGSAFRTAASVYTQHDFYELYEERAEMEWTGLGSEDSQELRNYLNEGIRDVLGMQVQQHDAELWERSNREFEIGRLRDMPFGTLWDERWLDWTIDQDITLLAACLARPDHQRCRDYFKDKLQWQEQAGDHSEQLLPLLLAGAERAGMSEEARWEGIVAYLESPVSWQIHQFSDDTVEDCFKKLPAHYMSRVAAVQEKFVWNAAYQIEEVIETMRT